MDRPSLLCLYDMQVQPGLAPGFWLCVPILKPEVS